MLLSLMALTTDFYSSQFLVQWKAHCLECLLLDWSSGKHCGKYDFFNLSSCLCSSTLQTVISELAVKQKTSVALVIINFSFLYQGVCHMAHAFSTAELFLLIFTLHYPNQVWNILVSHVTTHLPFQQRWYSFTVRVDSISSSKKTTSLANSHKYKAPLCGLSLSHSFTQRQCYFSMESCLQQNMHRNEHKCE